MTRTVNPVLEALRGAASRHQSNRVAPYDLRTKLAEVSEAGEPQAAAVALMEAIVLAEAVEKSCAAMVADLREVMALTLSELPGKVRIENDHFTAFLQHPAPKLVYSDAALIPPEFMRVPKPAPDANAIKAAIKSGTPVPGCALANGQPVLAIRAKVSA